MSVVGVTGVITLAGDGIKAVSDITGAHGSEKSWENGLATTGCDVVDGIDAAVASFREGREAFTDAVRKMPVLGGLVGGAIDLVSSVGEGVVSEANNVVQSVSDITGAGGEFIGGSYEDSERAERLASEEMPASLIDAISERGLLAGGIGWVGSKLVDGVSGLFGGGDGGDMGDVEQMQPTVTMPQQTPYRPYEEGLITVKGPVYTVPAVDRYLAETRRAMDDGPWSELIRDIARPGGGAMNPSGLMTTMQLEGTEPTRDAADVFSL